MRLLWWIALVVLLTTHEGQPAGRQFYASPTGLATNPGTLAAPLDLTKALSATSPLLSGDTLWLLAGTYTGSYVSDIKGTPSAPIIIRAVQGARVTFDNAPSPLDNLWLNGGYVWLWGFEVMSSNPQRQTADAGSFPNDLKRGTGVMVLGPGTKVIHLVIHDAKNGIGTWATAPGSELYGNLVYHNGWEASDRAHGHGIYAQNRGAALTIRDNIVFNQFGAGIHAYGSGEAFLENIWLDGNTIFNSTILWNANPPQRGANILIGGGVVAVNPRVTENVAYQNYRNGGNHAGYIAGCGSSLTMTGNTFVGGYPIIFTNCTGTVTGNLFAGIGRNPPYVAAYPSNAWVNLDLGPLKGQRVIVRPSPYESGRAHITVLNWDKASSVTADVSPVLTAGQRYELHDAQNVYAPPILTGTYAGGSLTIPMTGLTAVRPVGSVAVIPPHTAPEFAVFILRTPGSIATPTTPAPPTNVRILSGGA